MAVMEPLTEQQIRAAFVNCTKGESKRLHVPRDLAERPWADLDFLGWRDPRSPERAYLVTELDGSRTALALRCPTPGTRQPPRGMCAICLTSAVGVRLMGAARAGKAGQQGNSVGTYLCTRPRLLAPSGGCRRAAPVPGCRSPDHRGAVQRP